MFSDAQIGIRINEAGLLDVSAEESMTPEFLDDTITGTLEMYDCVKMSVRQVVPRQKKQEIRPIEENNERQIVELFRPLLDKINLSDIPEAPNHQLIELSEFDEFLKLGLGCCVLTIRRRNFTSSPSGYSTFSHKSFYDQDIFFFNIFLNNKLFSLDNLEMRIKRRRVLVHEFVHCIAAFLSVKEIQNTPELMTQLSQNLIMHMKFNIQEHYQSLLMQFNNNPIPIVNALEIFSDEHFRTGNENFYGSFTNIYKQLLLDNIIFEKYFTPQLQVSFNQCIKNGNITKALSILQQVSAELTTCEAISIDFINLRLREELLQYYYLKARKGNSNEVEIIGNSNHTTYDRYSAAEKLRPKSQNLLKNKTRMSKSLLMEIKPSTPVVNHNIVSLLSDGIGSIGNLFPSTDQYIGYPIANSKWDDVTNSFIQAGNDIHFAIKMINQNLEA